MKKSFLPADGFMLFIALSSRLRPAGKDDSCKAGSYPAKKILSKALLLFSTNCLLESSAVTAFLSEPIRRTVSRTSDGKEQLK